MIFLRIVNLIFRNTFYLISWIFKITKNMNMRNSSAPQKFFWRIFIQKWYIWERRTSGRLELMAKHIVVNEQILVAVWTDSLLTESVTDVCHSICCPVLTMILLQDQFYDIIGKLDPDNLNQILIYRNITLCKVALIRLKWYLEELFYNRNKLSEKPSRFLKLVLHIWKNSLCYHFWST